MTNKKKPSGADYSMESVKRAQKNYYDKVTKHQFKPSIKNMNREVWEELKSIAKDKDLTIPEFLEYLVNFYKENK